MEAIKSDFQIVEDFEYKFTMLRNNLGMVEDMKDERI